MRLEILEEKLSKIADIQICKAGYVFTLLMTGEKLTNFRTFNMILNIVIEETNDVYPIIETTKNGENYVLIVLRPE